MKWEKELSNKNEYYFILDKEVIDIIKNSLTPVEFKGYCIGNILKYRLRAGKKENNSIEDDLNKAKHYEIIYKEYDGLRG